MATHPRSDPNEAENARRKLSEMQPTRTDVRMGRRTHDSIDVDFPNVEIVVNGVRIKPFGQRAVAFGHIEFAEMAAQLYERWGIEIDQITWDWGQNTGHFANERAEGNLYWNGEFVDVNYDEK